MNRKYVLPSVALIFIFATVVAQRAHADAPLEPVKEITFCSKNQRYCAHSSVNPAHLDVFEKQNPRHVLWSRSEYVTKGFLSDDGRAVVSCYGGLNLIPLDATLDFLLARILHASGSVQEIKLNALYADIRQLPHTDSHLEWGHCVGIDKGEVLLERADGTQWRGGKL